MPANFLQEKRANTVSLGLVIALHAGALTALLLSKTEFITNAFDPTVVKMIPETKTPPPEPEKIPEKKEAVKQETVIKYVPPEIDLMPKQDVVQGHKSDLVTLPDPGPSGTSETKVDPVPLPTPTPVPVPDPVRTEARIDPRAELQPPYPPGEERAQNEGSVTVRILIGADGRVKEVEKVRATSEAFYRATEQHALRRWRFRPATVDGKPVESRTSMTVRFQLND